jgi:hypothetical protein
MTGPLIPNVPATRQAAAIPGRSRAETAAVPAPNHGAPMITIEPGHG